MLRQVLPSNHGQAGPKARPSRFAGPPFFCQTLPPDLPERSKPTRNQNNRGKSGNYSTIVLNTNVLYLYTRVDVALMGVMGHHGDHVGPDPLARSPSRSGLGHFRPAPPRTPQKALTAAQDRPRRPWQQPKTADGGSDSDPRPSTEALRLA